MGTIFIKDPDATLDYVVNWATWLVSDTIISSAWTVPTGLTQVTAASTTTTTTIWLSGGTAGNSYSVLNRIVTAAGRTDDRSLTIEVEQK